MKLRLRRSLKPRCVPSCVGSNQAATTRTCDAGLAHLWFVTLYPFRDGNGRLARAVAELALAQSESSSQRFFSMSSQIMRERKAYYDILERTQKGDMNITPWLHWFLTTLKKSIDGADEVIASVLNREEFWRRHSGVAFSERQAKVLNRVLRGFEGALTTKKWAAIGKCSIPTAQRDINDLLAKGALRHNPGGSKNTSYSPGL